MRVRLIEAADKADWLRMRLALWPESSPDCHLEEMEAIFSNLSATPVFVAEDGTEAVCGFLEASLHSSAEGCDTGQPVGYIEGWYVDPKYRRQGIGAILVHMAEAWAILQGCQEMASDCLIDNTASLEAHLALGYHETERLIHFRKSLDEPKAGQKASTRRR